MQTRLIPRLEYSCCNFSNDLDTLPFLVTLLSIVSTSNGSAATANTYTHAEIDDNSGEVIYIEYRTPIIRASDQTEDIKLVAEF